MWSYGFPGVLEGRFAGVPTGFNRGFADLRTMGHCPSATFSGDCWRLRLLQLWALEEGETFDVWVSAG